MLHPFLSHIFPKYIRYATKRESFKVHISIPLKEAHLFFIAVHFVPFTDEGEQSCWLTILLFFFILLDLMKQLGC